MNIKLISKKDELLKQIYYHRDVSSEAIDVLDGTFYSEKLKSELIKEGLLKKALLENTNKTARKRGVSFSIQSYYVSAKGKIYLQEKFPDEFGGEVLARKQSNDATGRLVKIADSTIMSEIAGACVPENYDADTVISNISRGVFITPSEAKKSLTLSKEEVAHYKFTAITGVLLTPTKPYSLYSAGNGFISQTSKGEERMAAILGLTFAKRYGLYPDGLVDARNTNAIIFCKNVGAFAKLVLNKYKSKTAPGAIFENSYIIPVSRNGCNILRKFIEEPEYKNKLANYLVTEYGYTRRTGYAANALPVENLEGDAVLIGIDFDVNNLRTAIDVVENDSEAKYHRIVILCYAWQQDYYNEVISQCGTDKIICQPIDEEALDEIVGFTNRIPTVKSRPRRKNKREL